MRPQVSQGWAMSLDLRRTYVVPDRTAQVIFPNSDPVMRLYDDLQKVISPYKGSIGEFDTASEVVRGVGSEKSGSR